MEVPVIRRTESHFAAGGGCSLFRRAWLPARPERVLVLVHGYAEHSGRYEHLGAWFAARGCVVEAYDQRGHGRSEGPRGHARRFEELLDDLGAFLTLLGAERPDLPAHLIGHSMGGLVVAAFTRERRPELAGAVLSAPVLQLVRPPGAAQRRALGLLRRVAPRLPLPQRIDPAALSRDPEVGRAYLADPLVFQRMTVSLAAGLFDAADRTLAGGAEVGVPMLLLHGEADPLCATSGSHALHAQLRPAGCALRLYPELRHEIFNEPEHEVVFSDLLDWVRKRDGL